MEELQNETRSYNNKVDVFSLAVSSLSLLEVESGKRMEPRTSKFKISYFTNIYSNYTSFT